MDPPPTRPLQVTPVPHMDTTTGRGNTRMRKSGVKPGSVGVIRDDS